MALSLQRYKWPYSDSSLFQLLKERNKREGEKSTGIAIENRNCLHESVVVEILSWLPVKDLLQYKSVCRSWYALISSPDFISKHLKNYYQNNCDWRGCLLARYCTYAVVRLFVMLVDETPRVLANQALRPNDMDSPEVCGPCDGLYFLGSDYGKHALWNPVINELKVLPPIITKYGPYLCTSNAPGSGASGFGFDPVSRDYKVVVIKYHWSYTIFGRERNNHPQSVLVYSLRNDSWRYCGDLRRYYELDASKCYNCVNGYCYWLESDYVDEDNITREAIISFNLAVEDFEEINLPDYKKPASKCLGIYDESLAFLSVDENEKGLEIWTLKEGIWSMKLRKGPLRDVQNPVGHWKDNKILLESKDGNLLLLDPESQDIKDLGFQNIIGCKGIFAFRESLVSIKDSSSQEHVEDHSEIGIVSETSESDTELGFHELFGEE